MSQKKDLVCTDCGGPVSVWQTDDDGYIEAGIDCTRCAAEWDGTGHRRGT